MIRRAVPDDGPAIMSMGEAFFHEAGHAAQFTFDRVSFAHSVIAFAQNGLLWVAEKNDQVVGMAAADMGPAYWNHNVLFAREAFWYIMPGHRSGGPGRELLVALENAVIDCGATVFDIVAEGEGKRAMALARLYRAAGFSPADSTFRKILEHGHARAA